MKGNTSLILIGDAKLRMKSTQVAPKWYSLNAHVLKDLSAILRKRDDAVAIAAPQIGINKAIFILKPTILPVEEQLQYKEFGLVCINPKIEKESKKTQVFVEGCLSVPGIEGPVERPRSITLQAQDEHLRPFKMKCSGFIAQAVQHEIDHLQGILFVDKAKTTYPIPKQ